MFEKLKLLELKKKLKDLISEKKDLDNRIRRSMRDADAYADYICEIQEKIAKLES